MTKEQLIQEIKDSGANLDGLESLTIVGSHGDMGKKFEKTNDIDVLFLLEKLDGNKFSEIKSLLDGVSLKFSNADVKVWPEYRIGPVKATYNSKEDMGVMLHALVFDIKSFGDYNKIAPFVTLDWLKSKALIGKNLEETYDFSFPATEDLLHAPRHSFDYYEKMISEKIYILLDIEVEGGEMKYISHTYEYPKEQWGELYADIVKKLLLNSLIVRLKENRSWEEKEIVDKFFELFPSITSEKDIAIEIIGLKKKIRNGELKDFNPVSYEPKVLELIKKIRQEVSKI